MSHPNGVHGNNRFKLGLFGLNVDNACAITTIDGVFHPTWDSVRRLTRMADNAGFEALVPVARWRGFGGVTNFNGACFETFTWAAGVGGATDHAAVFATSVRTGQARQLPHVATGHPLTDPLALIVSFYAFVEAFARRRGLNPDQPHNLRKVTETL